MNPAPSLHRSTIGRKLLMAITGLLLVGFVVGHMVGNLKIFLGPEALDHYAHGLKEFGDPFLGKGQFLWIARLSLLGAVGIHIWAALSLARQNRQARPVGYKKWEADRSTYASRTMRYGGVILLLFIIYHLLHLTLGTVHPDFGTSVYANVISGFQQWPVAAVYILANLALGLHLYHGFWSLFRTLGANNPSRETLRRRTALGVALVVALGNISIPVSVLTGILS
jgi:succinate dehydrogenase / fumarate reductase cytochrome b subunit